MPFDAAPATVGHLVFGERRKEACCRPAFLVGLLGDQFNKVRAMLAQGAVGIAQVAKEAKLTRQTVYRIKDDPASAEAALAAWGM